MKKFPPPNTLEELRPPNKNHNFFENWQSNPFKHDAESFEMVNAWWLSEAALLAYGNEEFVAAKFAAAGLTAAGFIVQSFTKDNIQCFIAHNNDFILAAFRGTEIDNFQGLLKDVMTDAKVVLVPDGAGGMVHHGFNEAISDIWDPIEAYLSLITSDGHTRKLWLTGHSLGAAIATLAADRITRSMNQVVSGLYTYGSPRVGNGDFRVRFASEGLATRTFRFVNNDDVVARVPPEVFYRHVGSLKLIDGDGNVHDVAEGLQVADEAASFDLTESAGETLESLFSKGGIVNNVPDFLADHAPIYYAIHIWNTYEG